MSGITHPGAVPPAGTRDAVRERREGVRAMLPMLVALIPFAVVVGAAVAQSDHRLAAWLGTSTIYGGAAHLAVLDLVSDGAAGSRLPPWACSSTCASPPSRRP
jgi:predicted branched-subunit amino acid permease